MPCLRIHMVAAPEKVMSIFKKKTPPAVPSILAEFPPEEYEPVIRASICTGEKTAAMRDRATGKLHEIMLVRTDEDLDTFCHMCGGDRESIRTVY